METYIYYQTIKGKKGINRITVDENGIDQISYLPDGIPKEETDPIIIESFKQPDPDILLKDVADESKND